MIYYQHGCYVSNLKNCIGGITGEHIISRSVLNVISSNGRTVTIEGFPWQNNQPHTIGISSVQINCLCRKHNSDLSTFDNDGLKLFTFQNETVIKKIYW